MTATYHRHLLQFKQPSGTSRGVLTTKETWFIIIEHQNSRGIGECGILRGLSADDRPDYQAQLLWTCQNIHLGLHALLQQLKEFPSIQFGLEMAFLSLNSQDPFELFPSKFTKGESAIPINGLIWMGSQAFMRQQVKERIDQGFQCIKLKIGAIGFEEEMDLLKSIRREFGPNDIQLRVDANGAFDPDQALEKLKRLSELNIHSVEQPIKTEQWDAMASLCEHSPLPIALDEELIGVFDATKKKTLLQTIKPQYIILKPSFVGGYAGSKEWIQLSEAYGMGWWVTSALESNVGLNAIAQWTYLLNNPMFQGLGTGSLFSNNFSSPLKVKNGTLHYDTATDWQFNL